MTGESIAAHLRTLGLVANAWSFETGRVVVSAGNDARDEDAVFYVTGDTVGAHALKLGRTKALRARKGLDDAAAQARCEEIAARFHEHAANRAEQAKAIEVADALKAQGLHCLAFGGKVHITLELSPKYAAEVGPKIAAAMSARKV